MNIRPATSADEDAIWTILESIIREGTTYPLPRDMPRADALAYWLAANHEVFVAHEDNTGDTIAGTYFLQANQRGGGSHVANCGYATATRGSGVGRAMCRHSLQHARHRGFRAMQFNFVVSSNELAIHLWQSCGFAIVGRLPGAFDHPAHGFVDALIMFQTL